MDASTASVVNTAIGALPAIIAAIRDAHAQAHPAAAAPSDASILAALQSAAAATIAKDEVWKAAHPSVTDQTGTQPAVD